MSLKLTSSMETGSSGGSLRGTSASLRGMLETVDWARRRLSDWVRTLGDETPEIVIDWEDVDFVGGPFDGLQRRVEAWKISNLPAFVEIPVCDSQFDHFDGLESRAVSPATAKAVYRYFDAGTHCEYRFAGYGDSQPAGPGESV